MAAQASRRANAGACSGSGPRAIRRETSCRKPGAKRASSTSRRGGPTRRPLSTGSALPGLEALAADPPARLEDTVRALHAAFLAAFAHEPRIVPAVFADLFGRPDGPAARVMAGTLPRVLDSLDRLLRPHVRAGRLRPLPTPVLAQLLLGPLLNHVLMRPVLESVPGGAGMPPMDEAVEIFVDAYLRAVALPAAEAAESGRDVDTP
ncbi:hypothetical protein ACIQI7_23400 [Kitasatospora sp. NPDC092039]|uniref:hypothetical protein n=1 Tax=Kitasatospora sp. NPDC092039 TaxID=3364086 RepID=UPI00380A0E90